MKSLARVVLTLLIVAAGCAGGYELWDYYMLSPWTRDARVQADVDQLEADVVAGRTSPTAAARVLLERFAD